jgi:hypothetical protein
MPSTKCGVSDTPAALTALTITERLNANLVAKVARVNLVIAAHRGVIDPFPDISDVATLSPTTTYPPS